MKLFRTLAVAATLFTLTAANAQAETNFIRKVDSFDFLVDYSGSMMMRFDDRKAYDGNKLEAAQEVLFKINRMIPEAGYQSSMHTFSPASELSAYGPWDRTSMHNSIDSLDPDQKIFNRRTGMGDGMFKFAPDYARMDAPTALILVSDGENNVGIDPVKEAYDLLRANPDLCLHIVSFADTERGEKILDKIAELRDCTITVSGLELIESDAAAEEFVKEIFYDIEDVIVLRGVNFAFDSYELDDAAKAILDELALLIADTDKEIVLEGWTDSRGTDAYNEKLSMNRALAVETYLEQQGVPAHMLSAVGMGESERFDNATEEGRYLNRRTELYFK